VADFHFLRPLWLALLVALPLLYWFRHTFNRTTVGWENHIPARLLDPLMPRQEQTPARRFRSPLLPLGLAITTLAIALAGPSWRQAPTPLKQSQDSLVIVLDLSISMFATDVEPDRLTRAKRKVRDILSARQGNLNALVVYAGDAHVVTPLTDDSRTIEALLDVLDPVIMPAQGNRADLAIEQAVQLLDQGATGQSRIVLLADQLNPGYQSRIKQSLDGTGYRLNSLVVGTEEGGPMPLPKHGFIRDGDDIVIAKADPEALRRLAESNDGQSRRLTLGDADIQALELATTASNDWADAKEGLTANRWQDDGYWLLWLAVPLLLLGWRRGAFALIALALLPMTLAPRPATALDWADLWQREDQQAPGLIEQNPETASQTLQQPGWRGAALYRSGHFDAAAQAFAEQPGAQGHYNRGNALARAGKLKQAIAAWEQALQENPELENARFNKKLVEQLLEQEQSSQNPDSENSSGEQPQDNASSDSSGSDHSQSPSNQNSPGSQAPPEPPEPPESTEPQTEQETQANKPGEADEGKDANAQPEALSEQGLNQGQEQWLRRIPDNPGGLLQRKFLQQHQERQPRTEEGDTPW